MPLVTACTRLAPRLAARRGFATVPKRQPSRHMDDTGRATLGRHLFNRENSITDYWVKRTDGKAKLLAANICLGLGVAATYQYNHFSGNLDPDVQANKSRRRDPMPHTETDGVNVLTRRNSRRSMHSMGNKMNRTNSKHTPGKIPDSTALDLSSLAGEDGRDTARGAREHGTTLVRFKSNDIIHKDPILGRIRDSPF